MDEFDKRDVLLSRPIIVFIILNVFCSFGLPMMTFLGSLTNYLSILRFVIPPIFTLMAFKYLSRKALNNMIILEVVFGISYFYSILMGNTGGYNIFLYLIMTIFMCIPFMALCMSIENYRCLYKKLILAADINSIILIVYLVITSTTITYSMPATYQLLFCAVFHSNEMFEQQKKKRVIRALLVIVEAVLVFIKGARGPLFCLALFIAIKAIIGLRKNRTALVITVFGSIFIFFAALNMNTVLNTIGEVLEKYNIYSRSFLQIKNHSIFDDSGRGAIQDKAVEYLMKNPVFGYGAAGELGYLNGSYPHSIFLELMLNFGVVFGLIVIIFLCYKTIKAFFYEDGIAKQLMIVFTVLGIVMLSLSSTYLQNIYIFMFLGISLKMKSKVVIKFSGRQRIV